jgi:hypothetical protein
MNDNKEISNDNTINKQNTNKKINSSTEELHLKSLENTNNIINDNNNDNNNNNQQTRREEVIYSNYLTTMKTDNIKPFCLCPKSRICLKFSSSKNCASILAVSIIIMTNIFQNIFVQKKLKSKILRILMIIFHNLATLITLFTFFNVATSSPGYQENEIIDSKEFDRIKPFITIQNEKIYLKFCQTCKIIRRPRTFHCKYCNKCVLRQDHHCDFVNNCIGKFNYIKFIVFLINVFIYCIFTLSINILFFYYIGLDFNELKTSDILCVCFNFINLVLAIIFGFQMICFLCTHFYLMCKNETTRESIKKNIDEQILDKGCKNNCHISCNKDYVEDFDKYYDEAIKNIIK